MKKIFSVIEDYDVFFVSQFQRFSDWAQGMFGITCFTLARISLLLMMGGLSGFILSCIFAGAVSLAVMVTVVSGLVGLSFFLIINKQESRCVLQPGLKNSTEFTSRRRREAVVPYMVCGVIFCPVVLVTQENLSFNDLLTFYSGLGCCVFYVCTEYLSACTPKPPQKSWLKKKIESLSFGHTKIQPAS
jgi:hypothetical protein